MLGSDRALGSSQSSSCGSASKRFATGVAIRAADGGSANNTCRRDLAKEKPSEGAEGEATEAEAMCEGDVEGAVANVGDAAGCVAKAGVVGNEGAGEGVVESGAAEGLKIETEAGAGAKACSGCAACEANKGDAG